MDTYVHDKSYNSSRTAYYVEHTHTKQTGSPATYISVIITALEVVLSMIVLPQVLR